MYYPKEELESIEKRLEVISELMTNMSSPPEHIIYNNKQCAELFGISSKTLQKWRDNRLIKFSQIGREIFYTLRDILDFLDKHSVPSQNQ